MSKSNPPSIEETAFDCPYCRAFTTQHWHQLRTTRIDDKTPYLPDVEFKERLVADSNAPPEIKSRLLIWIDKMRSGLIFLDDKKEDPYSSGANNIFLSECYNCRKFAVWVHDRLVHPTTSTAPPVNQDMPPDVVRDYEEGGRIVAESPRGAAALLRLAIQKLCIVLGENGKNIDDDIASLVKKGLNPMIQKALDAVRVIGNEAVHPGTLDLKDDRDTAIKLFKLVNIIADQMISNPKHVEEVYGQIPEAKRKAIEKRDGS
jgi:Domain of unknown function (DUF4145)